MGFSPMGRFSLHKNSNLSRSLPSYSPFDFNFSNQMGINPEFLKSLNAEITQETTQEIKIEKLVPDKIIELMITEPSITARQIAEHLDVSFDGVRYHIKKLRADGRIKREGSTKSGKWVVVK